MSPPSRSPFSRPAGLSADDLAQDLERRLDMDDEYSFINPSVVSSLAQLSARSTTRGRGESSASVHTPRFPGGGISDGNTSGIRSAPTKLGSSKLLKAVFIGANELESLCLGFVGNKSRFCIAPKTKGGMDCGVVSHKRNKMEPPADTFWLPGGSILNKPTAKNDLCIPIGGLSENAMTILTEGLLTEARWVGQFKDILQKQSFWEERRARSGASRSSEVESVDSTQNDEAPGETSIPQGGGKTSHVSEEEEPPMMEVEIDTTAGWEAVCVTLQAAINDMASTIAEQARTIADLRRIDPREDIESIQENSAVLQSQLGDLYDLVVDHGNLSNAMAVVMASSSRSAEDIAILTAEMEALDQAMKDFSASYRMSPDVLVRLIDKLAEKMDRNQLNLARRVTTLEGTPSRSSTFPAAAATPPTATATIDLDTIFGASHVGGTPVDISMNYMVSRLHSLSTSIVDLESRLHSSGISFEGMNFHSDEDFVKWFMANNPRGLGMSAFVDIISIWSFLNVPQTSAEWLSMLEKSAKLGFGPLDTAYIHSMTYKYPPKFAGKATVILSTEHIKMLKSMDDWRGTSEGMSMGDGIRDQLLSEIRSAATNHAQYCRDNLPEGKFRSMAIQTGNETLAFFIALVGYLEAEITTLGNLSIQDSHVLLLLSNQIVRMCDDIHEIRTHGSRTSLDNHPLAAARFACVTLRALACMNAFATARFKDHPAINSAYMRFLTCSVASQSNLGVKDTLEALVKRVTKVEKVAAEAATKESLTKLDNKVTALGRGSNANQQGGGGGARA